METEKLLSQIEQRGTVLFGAGYVAETFFRALSEKGLRDRVRGCIVTKKHADRFHGLPVYELADYAAAPAQAGAVICIAVHGSVCDEAERSLREAGLRDMVWIYPNALELGWGAPLRDAVWIPVEDLLRRQDPAEGWIPVRYAALAEAAAGKDDGAGSSLYRKAIGLFSGKATVEKRLSATRAMLDSMRAAGYDPTKPILIDTRCRIIDGMHRLSAAKLLGISSVPCRIVEASERFTEYFSEDNRFTPAAQQRAALTEAEARLLRETRNALLPSAREPAPRISIILPVYTVEDYIDVCIKSLVGQTMREFEILAINDGSLDGSLEKCLAWRERDPRVFVFDTENAGVAAARNLGLKMARGEYVAFVDPDDWVEDTYLEKLYTAAKAQDADFAECDLWRYDNRSGQKIYRCCYGRMGRAYTLREHMKYGPTATYKSISRKSVWERNSLLQPSCSFESPAVYSLLLALSERVVSVREPLYYYRRFRENSLIENGYAAKDGTPNNTLAIDAMRFLMDGFRRTGLCERYAETLEGVVKYRLSDILAMQYHRKAPADYAQLVRNYRAFLTETFPAGQNAPYLTWGGYNLNRILTHMAWLHDPNCRFNFSSMIAAAQDAPVPYTAAHKNRYRKLMLQRELDRAACAVLCASDAEYVFLDLIEERFDILELCGAYFTMSDAFMGGCFTDDSGAVRSARELVDAGRVIKRDSEACGALWRGSCAALVTRLKAQRPGLRFVVVENYLSETVGDLNERRPYDDLARIRRTNAILRGYYDYLKTLLPEALVFSPAADDLYFTDERYEYGDGE
ncbi:MAG: glycosyltransferase, partial [Oscillospiraceae bacterium]|nr:glycosyltransferase [Oscillospiraceae bacterium]